MTTPKLKVIPIWRKNLLKLVKQGYNVKAVCHTLHVGYDRVLNERRRDPEFAAEMDSAVDEGRANGHRHHKYF